MYEKNCPLCFQKIIFKNKYCLKQSIKNNAKCKECLSKSRCGVNNPFYDKKHTQETLDKIAATKSTRQYPIYQSEEFRDKMSLIGKNNKVINGRSTYQILLDKYGKEEADIRIESANRKRSIASSGNNNPMYGKPAPKKAGNGWSGWYKGQFFRSLRELSYIVTVLEPSGKEWRSAESIRIPYINYDGSKRTYSPDFICDGQLIEIKPKKLIESSLVRLKSSAAIKYCAENNLKFIITDISILDKNHLVKLIENGLVKLTDKTKIKYERFINE